MSVKKYIYEILQKIFCSTILLIKKYSLLTRTGFEHHLLKLKKKHNYNLRLFITG